MTKEGQKLHHLVVEVDGELALEFDALSVNIRPDVEHEYLRESFESASGYEVVSPRVIIEAECPGEARWVERFDRIWSQEGWDSYYGRKYTRDEAMLIAPSLMAIEGVGDAT